MSARGQGRSSSTGTNRLNPRSGRQCCTAVDGASVPRADIVSGRDAEACRGMGGAGVAAVAIEGETEKRSQRSDGRVLLRIRSGIGCGNDDDQEPAAILATRRQHRCSQCIALGVGILTWLSGRPCMRWRAGRCGIRMGRAALIRSLVSFEEARAGARIVLDTGAFPLLAFVENPPKKFLARSKR